MKTAKDGVIDWKWFFVQPLPPLPGELVELSSSPGGMPGLSGQRARWIRKLTILTLWPEVAGDPLREQALLSACNTYTHMREWLLMGTALAPCRVRERIACLLQPLPAFPNELVELA
jgi:hypothetical protein